MSGSLWLRPGVRRDSLPAIPRPRGGSPGPGDAVPGDAGRAEAEPADAGRADAAPGGAAPAGEGAPPAATPLPPAAGSPPPATPLPPAAGSPPPAGGPLVLADDPLDELADRIGPLAAAAVHPDEIAAILESDGMTDEHIRLTYGREDSFALGEELYARVERRHPEPAPEAAPPWYEGLGGCLLRGLVFALPGLAYVLGGPLPAGPPGRFDLPAGTVPLLAGAVAGWVWNQALAHRAYTWLGLGDRAAAARTLLTGAPAGALAGTVVAVAWTGPGEWPATAFAAGQALYLAGATVLLVLGRERALLCALSPLAGALFAFSHDLPDALRVGLLLASLTATLGCAAAVLLPAATPPDPSGGAHRRAGPPLVASLPYGLFGLGTGLLVLYAAVGDVLASDGPADVVAAPSAVALTLSMGPAEWLLHRFRGESRAGLRLTTTTRAFGRAAAAALVLCLVGYLAALLALALAGTLAWPGAGPPEAGRLLGLLLIGVVLWLGLLLQAYGAVLGAGLVCLLAAAAQMAAPAAAGPAAVAAAAVVLAAWSCALLVRPTAHRA
ncbi:hypothetical protein [Streptomyces tritici]|uniref:hypothetical protein n=1 Tax=Streptomyces tritici TaxID=2054410 RepID=UPI003AF07C0A